VRRLIFKKSMLWLPMLGLALMLLGGIARAETLKVTQPNQSLYPDPDFASTPVAPVPVGAEVNVERRPGDWYKVEYQGKIGWINRQAFPAPSTGSKFLKSFIPFAGYTAPVKETSTDEVALGGKGFTPESESAYRQEHPEAKFGEVDKVEAYQVDPAKLQAFMTEGGMRQ
jgi:hypothetical protein